ncbi:hypothetical protein LCGC14_3021080, partial [marine sediment metagenome]
MSPVSDVNQPRIIALANQKGGVGKTTTAINLGAALAEDGWKVLLVDLDPQGNASTGLGIDQSQRDYTTYDLMIEGVAADKVVAATHLKNLFMVPATSDLSSADMDMLAMDRRMFLLRDALNSPEMLSQKFDFILID